jgi:transketolase C-terminal domain/subunit
VYNIICVGQSKVVKEGKELVIVGGGVTTHEALKAAKELEKEGINVTVVDIFSVKPIDRDTLLH